MWPVREMNANARSQVCVGGGPYSQEFEVKVGVHSESLALHHCAGGLVMQFHSGVLMQMILLSLLTLETNPCKNSKNSSRKVLSLFKKKIQELGMNIL